MTDKRSEDRRRKKVSYWNEEGSQGRDESLSRSKSNYAKRKKRAKAREVWMENHGLARPTRRSFKPKRYTVSVGEKDVEILMFTIGALAAALGKSTQSVRLWEKNKVIPECTFRDDRGRRMYTEHQLRAIVHVFDKHMHEKSFSWADSKIPGGIREMYRSLTNGVWTDGVPPWEDDSNE
jgi:hypothetical protein